MLIYFIYLIISIILIFVIFIGIKAAGRGIQAKNNKNISKDKNLAQTIKEKYKTVPQIWNEKNEHIGGYAELRNHVYSQWDNVGGYKGD